MANLQVAMLAVYVVRGWPVRAYVKERADLAPGKLGAATPISISSVALAGVRTWLSRSSRAGSEAAGRFGIPGDR